MFTKGHLFFDEFWKASRKLLSVFTNASLIRMAQVFGNDIEHE